MIETSVILGLEFPYIERCRILMPHPTQVPCPMPSLNQPENTELTVETMQIMLLITVIQYSCFYKILCSLFVMYLLNQMLWRDICSDNPNTLGLSNNIQTIKQFLDKPIHTHSVFFAAG